MFFYNYKKNMALLTVQIPRIDMILEPAPPRNGPSKVSVFPHIDDGINENVQSDESSEIRIQPKVVDAFVTVQRKADENH